MSVAVKLHVLVSFLRRNIRNIWSLISNKNKKKLLIRYYESMFDGFVATDCGTTDCFLSQAIIITENGRNLFERDGISSKKIHSSFQDLLLCNLVLFSKLNFQKIIQSSVNDSFCELQNYYQSHVARFMINIHDTNGEKCVEIVKHN